MLFTLTFKLQSLLFNYFDLEYVVSISFQENEHLHAYLIPHPATEIRRNLF